jgi:hypothetical protein
MLLISVLSISLMIDRTLMLEYRDALRPFKFQFFFDVLVHVSDDHAEFFTQSRGFLHGHRFLICRTHRRQIETAQKSQTEADTQEKSPSTPKGLCVSTD